MTPPKSHTVQFPETAYPSVSIAPGESLSTHLTLNNSPILFGCRTGICGTCLVSVTGNATPPDTEEQEMLDILAPGCPTARLACQVQPHADLFITVLKP